MIGAEAADLVLHAFNVVELAALIALLRWVRRDDEILTRRRRQPHREGDGAGEDHRTVRRG